MEIVFVSVESGNYTFVYHLRLVGSVAVACKCRTKVIQHSADDSESTGE